MSDYYKLLVQEIQKRAEEVPGRKKGPKVTATAPARGTPGTVPQRGVARPPLATGPQGSSKDPEVVKMQEALINLATTVSTQLNTKVDRKNLPLGLNVPDEAHKPASGQTSFSDFIVNRYMGGGEAVQSQIDPTATKHDVSTQSTPNRMLGIMNTMSRIGGSDIKGQFSPDGKWGPKTNDGIKNARAFGSAMLQLANDFNISINSYSSAQLQGLTYPVKDTDWSPSEKHTAAKTITDHINLIAKMFSEIKTKLLNNPETKKYIEGAKPYASYKKITRLTQDEEWAKNLLAKSAPVAANNILIEMPQPGGQPGSNLTAVINYKDLISPTEYNKWYNSDAAKNFKQTGVTGPDIIDAIRNKIKSLIPAPAAPTPAPPAAGAPTTAPATTGVK